MKDKRDECDCHRECTVLDHLCDQPCTWPACLTPDEEREFAEQLNAEFEENGWI